MPRDFPSSYDAVEHQDVAKADEIGPLRIGRRGIRAIQGEPETAETTSTDVSPTLPEQPGQRAAEASHEAARLAARQALAEKGVQGGRLLDARRHASEAAARATLGRDAVNLDEVAPSLGMRGNNFPTYDILSSNAVASVKTHWGDDGSLNEAARQAYRRDFEHLFGWGREAEASKQDAQNIIKAREAGAPVPPALRTASSEEVAQYLRDHSVLLVPDDHVETIRADLRTRALEFPENYYLSSPPSEVEIDRLLKRVRGLGLSSGEIRAIIAELKR